MSRERLRIFLVDDNDIDLAVNSKLIHLAHIADSVVTYTSAERFLDAIASDPSVPTFENVLLLDIMMPSMDGFACMERFATLPEPLVASFRVYMLSSSIDRNDIRRAEATPHVLRVLEKPLDTYLLKNLLGQDGF